MLTKDQRWAADLQAVALHPRAGGHHREPWPLSIRSRDRRMGALPPVRSQPVENPESIASLIVVAAVLLDAEVPDGLLTLEQFMKKMRELLQPGQTLSADAVRSVLPRMEDCLATVRGGWRWKRREPVFG